MSKKFTYTDSGDIKTIPLNEILEFRSAGNYTYVVFCDERKDLLVSIQIGKINEHLTEEHNFVRIHNCHYVNFDYARKVTRGRRPLLVMDYALPITVGKTYVSKIRKRFRRGKT